MLYRLLFPLHDVHSVFNVFRYITFRTAYAIITALIISFIIGPYLINKLKELQIGQNIRPEGPKNHLSKAGTPTMGGILIIISLFVPTLLWADLANPYIWLALIATLGFGLIGFMDDYIKVIRKRSLGLRGRSKLIFQALIALFIGIFLYFIHQGDPIATKLSIPFFKELTPDLGIYYIPLVVFIIMGTSNAVNLTDGLDGLAIGPMIIAAMAFMIIAYLVGNVKFAQYLNIFYVKGAGELAIFAGSLIGASLGFLWFNAYPAQMFMGDVGALALGGALGTIAVITKHEIVLVIVGGIFVIETISVILQVISFKLTGKRIFRMAPLHHHFEAKGWEEPKIIVRFWIVAILLALLSLSTLKLR